MTDTQPPKLRIFMVRHGETEWNRIGRFQGRSDQPLNEKGRSQAQALAIALKNEPFTAFYASPLPRALETAGFIRNFHPEIPLIEEPKFMEMDLGEFEGMDGRLWMENHGDFIKAWANNPGSTRMPGGESLEEVQCRALEALTAIREKHEPGEHLLFCSHNFVLLTLLCHALEIPLNRFREIKKGTASYSILTWDGSRFRVDLLNERSHLKGL
ncbi:MAG TPA: histidine phosphatase family protein [Thermodesulfobacteriota bacterium]|nr:histidine phosphatase family protein [Thermodesulfobacteriota bacterium]